jgi:KTSC domain
MAEMVPVDSSVIEEVGFEAGELVVKFRDGGTYVYSVVPESVFQSLLGAESIGSFFNREIRPYYDCHPL